jgi:hypothetical protein
MVSVMLLVVSWVFGEKINLINGETIVGEIKGKSPDKIYLYSQTLLRFIRIETEEIFSIVDDNNKDITQEILLRENFNHDIEFGNMFDVESRFEPKEIKKIIEYQSEEQKNTYKFKLFPFSTGIALIAFAVDSYCEASNLSDEIKELEDADLEPKGLKRERFGKNVLGTVCVISSFISFGYSFEKIEIQASPTSVSLAYRF